jgi:UDP-3-O-[3-hydroxymyristoyl] glucosamine N-acyltransferase
MNDGWRLEELARLVGGTVRGEPGRLIRAVAPLDAAGPEELSFLINPRYRAAARTSAAGAFLVGPGTDVPGRDLLVADEPYPALATILERLYPAEAVTPGVSPAAHVEPSAVLGRDVAIGPFAVVGAGAVIGDGAAVSSGAVVGAACRIGAGTTLHPRVVLYPGTEVGARCVVHAGAVLGADGFGFATSKGTHRKIPQLGRVVVEDDVEIGANTTIDRGALGETRIGRGSKIDDLVMIAHGVTVGPGALLAAQAGISGSTRLGRNVTFAGQSGAAGHLRLGDGVIVAAKTAVLSDVPDGAFVAGIPAVDHRTWKRSQAAVRTLPELKVRLRSLIARIAALEGRSSKGEA